MERGGFRPPPYNDQQEVKVVNPFTRFAVWVVLLLTVASVKALAQAYLDGREVLNLANASRYEEAFALAQKFPDRYAQWAALMLAQRLYPVQNPYDSFEAAAKGAEIACRYASVNKEGEAVCYYLLRFLLKWKDMDPRAARALSQVSVPALSLAEIDERVSRLAKEGVPFALFRDVQDDEAGLRKLVESSPYSLGGATAAIRLALLLWEREKYEEGVALSLRVAGFSGTSGGILAYGEFHGIGVKKDTESACRRSLYWAKRSQTGPAIYTLALCYLEGAGGLPKDPALAYGLFWVGKERSRYPHFATRIKELEQVLNPDQRADGRRRASEFIFQ